MSHVIDPHGARTTYVYDSSDKLKRIQDPYNRLTTFVVTGNLLTKHVTPELCTTEIRYDSFDRMQAVIAPDGCRTTYGYYDFDWIEYVEGPDGARTTYVYDSRNKTTVTDAAGNDTVILYDNGRDRRAVIDPTGIRTSYIYNREVLQAQINPDGTRTSYTYSSAGGVRVLEGQQTAAGRTTNVFDSDGLVIARVDPLGNRTTTIRDSNDHVVAHENPLGHRTSYVYDNDDRLVATINPLGNRNTTVYDSDNQVIATIDGVGNRTSYSYSNGQQVAVTSPNGYVSSTVYDLSNRVLASITPSGARTSYLYDTGCRTLATIYPVGYREDERLRLQSTRGHNRRLRKTHEFRLRLAWTPDSQDESARQHHDSCLRQTWGRALASIDPLGNRTSHVYQNGRAASSINPLGKRTTTVFDSSGRPVASINPLGKRWTTVFDAAGLQSRPLIHWAIATLLFTTMLDNNRLASIPWATERPQSTTLLDRASHRSIHSAIAAPRFMMLRVGPWHRSIRWTTVPRLFTPVPQHPHGRTTYLRDVIGQTSTQIDARGYRTTTIHDDAGRTLATIDVLGNRTTTVYDKSRSAASINAQGYRTTLVFNDAGKRAASIDAGGNRWTTAFDDAGRSIASINPLGNRTTVAYDAAGRARAIINSHGNRSTTVYNAAGNTIATIDGLGNRTTHVFDDAGRRIAEINALGNRTTTTFNAADQSIALIDARGHRHSFTYDDDGQQMAVVDPLGRRTTSGYDAAGRQSVRIDARGHRTTYAHGATGLPMSHRYPDGSRVTFAYDELGNRTLMHDATGRSTYSYDALSRYRAAGDGFGHVVTYAWDDVGNRTHMETPESGYFTYAYDANGRTTSLENPWNELTTFEYDSAGRRTAKRLANGTRESLTYDVANQVTLLSNLKSDGSIICSFDYQYNAAGIRTRVAEDAGDRVTWIYDDANRLLAERRSGTHAYAHTFIYDAVGNRLVNNADGVRSTWSYDDANQIRNSKTSGLITTYVFDANGNQASVKPQGNVPTTTTWDYENQPSLVQEFGAADRSLVYNADLRRVIRTNGSSRSTFTWDQQNDSHLRDNNSVLGATDFTTEPRQYGLVTSQHRGGTTLYLHADALSSTRAASDEASETQEREDYTAYGKGFGGISDSTTHVKFLGGIGVLSYEQADELYVRRRCFTPSAARWMSRDPAYFVDGPNLYKFFPAINHTDPSGLQADGTVPVYDSSAVSACQALIRSIDKHWKYPCAKALLRHFLGQSGGTVCPSACKDAVQKELLRHFSDDRSSILTKELFEGCGRATAKAWNAPSLLRGSGTFGHGDLFYAFHHFRFVYRGAGHLVCGAGDEKTPCCCTCRGSATLEGNFTDDFDFCSSLPGTAVPPWQEKGRVVPSASSLAWCGCVLEDYFKKMSGTGMRVVGGKTFKVDCPMRLDVVFSPLFCEAAPK